VDECKPLVLGLMLPNIVIAELKSGSRHCGAEFKEASAGAYARSLLSSS